MAGPSMKVKKGDTVLVISGPDRGAKGRVIAAYPKEQRILVEGVNRIKKHTRVSTTQRGAQSGGHGTQRKHRSPGSIGGCATPGRVFKGLRMAGRMGNARTTVMNLTVHGVDAERGLLLIKGAVPGPKGGLVLVRNAVKRPVPTDGGA